MENNIAFSLHRVSKALSSKPFYRAVLQNNGVFGDDELAERLASHTNIKAVEWRYFINAIADEVEKSLLEGIRVNFGRLALGLAIQGSFASEDEEFDKSKHRLALFLCARKPFRDTLGEVIPENVARGLTCSIGSVMDASTKRLSEVTGTNRLLIQGRHLGISPDNPDEGVWLADPKTGNVLTKAVVEQSDAQTIDCVFEQLPTPGEYTLVVSCRNGARESLSPAVAKVKNFKVLASQADRS